MNKTLTSREAILAVCKEIVIKSGIQALNMRTVAENCGVAVGSVYNYFPSKGDLIVATVESIWTEILHGSKWCCTQSSFVRNIHSLFENVQVGAEKYPSFFSVHSMSFANGEKGKGREVMNQYFGHIRQGLSDSLERDPNLRADAFTGGLTKSAFVDFVFSNIIMLLMREDASCDCLLEIVKRIIY